MSKAPDAILRLVENFDRHIQSYHSSAYNEAQLRQDFLNPFFEAMGWDVANRKGYDQRYREVVHEDALKVGGTTKAPDYCFQIGGVRRFFVEAKAPFRDIGHDPLPALQVRRYAWTAKLPLSLLSDFEELSIYDTRLKPLERDKPGTARLRLLTHHEYETAWEELVDTFSPDAILRGSFEKYAQKGGKRGTTQVDDEFLKDIERWRDLLARNIALRNPRLGDRDLNAAVQRTIDRIIFLRICEDRGIEPAGSLQSLLNGPRIYPRLFELFQRADDRYNSGLFHFSSERGREEPDTVAARLQIDDAALKTVISQLYYPSPYEFSVFPADILGQVYEQFLGKVIRLTEGHHAKVEEKPEVRKAGGVYYTPTYIVDYIVKNTVGKLLEGKTPKTAARLRILDPACGSGSFLLGAYQYLLDWHGDWYAKDGPDKHRKELYKGPGGEWRLTTQEKKRILLDNIYGVDIDAQAVEVTKLSLLLKVLEGESEQTIDRQMKMYAERALPDLANNIKCGNSLIGSDFWQGQQQGLFDDEAERLRINAFDWDHEFKDIMAAGGFDAVIGNPPYINVLELSRTLDPNIKPYWKTKYESAAGSFDIYVLFIEQARRVARDNAYLSFIVPNKFLAAEYAMAFRAWILRNVVFDSLVDYSRVKVWPPSVYPVIATFLVGAGTAKAVLRVLRATAPSNKGLSELPSVPGRLLRGMPDNVWSVVTQPGAQILSKALSAGKPLESIAELCTATTVAEGSDYPSLLRAPGRSALKPATARFVVTGSIDRFTTNWETEPVRYMHKSYDRPVIALRSPMPVRRREQARTSKFVMAKVALRPEVFWDQAGSYVGAYTTYIFPREVDPKYLLGVLNSELLAFVYRCLYDSLAMGGGYLRYQPQQVRRLPIVTLDATNRADKSKHDKMVELVERMLDLHKRLPRATGAAKTTIERQIAATDKSIDALVYELYGLTDKEIRTVEEGAK